MEGGEYSLPQSFCCEQLPLLSRLRKTLLSSFLLRFFTADAYFLLTGGPFGALFLMAWSLIKDDTLQNLSQGDCELDEVGANVKLTFVYRTLKRRDSNILSL